MVAGSMVFLSPQGVLNITFEWIRGSCIFYIFSDISQCEYHLSAAWLLNSQGHSSLVDTLEGKMLATNIIQTRINIVLIEILHKYIP